MKWYRRIAGFLFIIFIFGLAAAALLQPDRAYSAAEKRNLTQFPALSLRTIADGSFMDRMEDYAADQFPLRDTFMRLKTRLSILRGSVESQGVYRCKDGSLMERFDAPDRENYKETLAAISAFSARYKGPDMYFMLVPNAVSVYPEKLPDHAPTEDQNAYMDRFYKDLPLSIRALDLRNDLNAAAADTQLYYASDHHWTTDAALIAFMNYKKTAGLDNVPPFHRSVIANDFTGSLVSESGFSVPAPDAITVYLPEEPEDFYYTVSYTNENLRRASCYETEKLKEDDKYQVFFGGNHPIIEINTSLDSTRSLLVIKDSYANCFLPFLVPEYRSVTVVDPRYYYDDIDVLMESRGFTDVLFLYNVNTFAEDTNLKTVLKNAQ